MSLASLLLFAGVLMVAAGTPGPSIVALVSQVVSRGMRGVLPFLLAMWIGEAAWLSLAVFGLAVVAQTFHLVFLAIKWLGVAYLLFLAWKMWNAPDTLPQDGEIGRDSPWRMFATGLAVTLGNPKIMMFYAALLPTLIDLATVSTIGWLELTSTMLLVLAAVDVGWILFAARARRLLTNRRAVKIANRIGAGAMAGAATAIATRS